MQKNIKLGSKKKSSVILFINKNKLIRRLKKININNDLLIFKLINNNVLDYSIEKLNNKCILKDDKPILKKEYIDSYNHYIYILDNFIDYFHNCFNAGIDSEYDILSSCLNGNDNILLSKYYVFNNDNIDYYKMEYNKIIISNFYYNAYDFRKELNSLFDDFSTRLEKIDIDDTQNIEKILEMLKTIYMYNKDRHIVLALFNRVDSSTYKFYLESFEFMFYSYFSKRGKIKTNYN
ncbi:MAG: hypothetical protein ACI310_04150 [Bacilli bacterium]